jgi:hypothetical protein
MVLAEVYLKHSEALEWDLFYYWKMDILDPRLTIRRLRNFFDRLPADSETLNDIAEIPRITRTWDVNTWMLANVMDILQAIDWHIIAANSKRTPNPPKPVHRPELKTPSKATKKKAWPGKTIIDRGTTNG